ncbi:MAG: hypothetical protein ACNI27_05570 [Desulfovibrio sp.]
MAHNNIKSRMKTGYSLVECSLILALGGLLFWGALQGYAGLKDHAVGMYISRVAELLGLSVDDPRLQQIH